LVVDPGPHEDVYERGRNGFAKSRKRRRSSSSDKLRLLKVYVREVKTQHYDGVPQVRIWWSQGARYGFVYLEGEGNSWTHGHGPQARAALLAMRAMNKR